jgi:RNA polymerase sigma factor (sigma-70 family)
MKTLNRNDLNENWDKFILDGDLNALSLIYFHFYDRLYSYGLKHSSSKQLVEDTIQNVFLNLIKYRNTIRQVRSLAGYLTSSFRHQLFLDMKSQKRIILTDQFPEGHFDYYRNSDQVQSEGRNLEAIHATIRECVSHLTRKQQEIIYLRFELGISYDEISSMLNISVDSSYKSVYRSVQAIRSQVEKIIQKKGALIFFNLMKFISGKLKR